MELAQETYFAKTRKRPYKTEVNYKTVVQSPNFENPWAAALAQGTYNTKWEQVKWSVGDVSYYFT